MIGDEIGSIHKLFSRLINHLNRIYAIITIGSGSLFPGLHLEPDTKSILNIVGDILTKTNPFRLSIEKTNRQSKETARDFLHLQDRMRWHNEIGELVNELHTRKHDFLRVLKDQMVQPGFGAPDKKSTISKIILSPPKNGMLNVQNLLLKHPGIS